VCDHHAGLQDAPDSIAYPPKILFEPSLEGYVNLFTTRTRVSPDELAALPRPRASPRRSCAAATW
jgi:multiple sugar transport system permease protein